MKNIFSLFILTAFPMFALAAPQILFLGSNIDKMYSNSNLNITAVVTHPDGIDEIIGGVLLDESGFSYGPLVSADKEGAYGISLTWNQINELRPIYAPIEGSPRIFTVKFFDQKGSSTVKNIAITLGAFNGVHSICWGKHYNLSNDIENCGSCGRNIKSLQLADSSLSHAGASCVKGNFDFLLQVKGNPYISQPESCNNICAKVKNSKASCKIDKYSVWTYWLSGWSPVEERVSSCDAIPELQHSKNPNFGLNNISCSCLEQ